MNPYMPKYLKSKNRMLIFELVRSQHTTSRAELVRITGMSFPTILKIVDKLLELGILIELEEMEQPSGAGRRGHLLRFNPRAYYAIGIEFEGQVATLGLVDLLGTCQYCRAIHLPVQNHSLNLVKLNQEVDSLLELAAKEQIPVLGIGIGFPAMVNPQNNSILHMTHMNITQEIPFCEAFPDFICHLDLPIFLDNDVNYACQGESFLRRHDAAYNNLMYVTLGTGLGASFLLNGELWYGSNHKSGEIGNMLMWPIPSFGTEASDTEYSAPMIFEDLINLDAIYQRFHLNLQQNPGIPDSVREEIIDYLCPYLSYALVNLVYTMDIQQCTLTGIIPMALGHGLLEKLQKSVDQLLAHNKLVITPSISRDAGIVGASVTVFRQCLEILFDE